MSSNSSFFNPLVPASIVHSLKGVPVRVALAVFISYGELDQVFISTLFIFTTKPFVLT